MNFERLCVGCMREKKENEKICPYCGRDEEAYVVPKQALQPFTILNGKYLLGRVLGIGGFGIAYIAVDIPLERRIAIKEFFPAGSAYREEETTVTLGGISEAQEKMVEVTREKFAAEARMLAQLEAMDGIVKVYDFFEENRTAYIVMEYLDGITLKDYVKGKNKLSWKETLTKIRPVLHSLEILHENGILHRDISPDNIMVLKDESLKLFDFGGAKDQAAQQGVSVVAFKKAGYSPIEQYQVDGELGAWSDEYALAATMYYCICGHAPAEASSRVLDSSNLKTPHQEGIELPKEAEKALLKGLSIKATDRYPSLKEFEAALYETKRLDQDWIKKAAVIGIGVLVVAGAGVCAGQLMSGNKAVSTVENKVENKTEATEKNKAENAGALKTEKGKHRLTVVNGGGTGIYTQGKEVTIKAKNRSQEGYEFVGWKTTDGNVEIKNSSAAETTIVVPDQEATIEAVYQEIAETETEKQTETEPQKMTYSITVSGGSGSGEYAEKNTVAIKAEDRTAEGYEFVSWKTVAGNVQIENSSSEETTIVVQNQNATIGASYQKTEEKLLSEGKESFDKKEYKEAIANFRAAANRGNAEAQYWLAVCYESGDGVAEDDEKAVEYYEKAAEAGYADAQFRLGVAYAYAFGEAVEKDLTKAVEWFQRAAYQENEGAQYNLASAYLYGVGVEQNSLKAAEWFEKAAMQGDSDSQYELGRMYIEGNGIKKDEEKGKAWLQKAADQENKYAQKLLNRLMKTENETEKEKETEKRPETEKQKTIEELSSDGYESYWNEDYEEAVKNFQEAADRGDADAQEMLAICYEYGRGVAQDDEQATMWYQKAAEQYQKAAEEGDAEAEYDIGRLYMFGEGVEQDSAKAVEWFQKAADQGHELAPYYLANCYLYGDGVEKNTEKAAEWLEKLAVEGWSDSQYMLGKLYIEGDGVEKDEEKGKAWLQKAADQGYEDAQKLLDSLKTSETETETETEKQTETETEPQKTVDELLEEGYESYSNKKYEEAVKSFQAAADRGSAEAQYELAKCYRYGHGVVRDYEQAVIWYEKAAEQGLYSAQRNLADCYFQGIGVERDYEQAAIWYEKAAIQGRAYGQYMLGKMYINGDGVEKDEEKGKAWLQKAADQEYEDAQVFLGSLSASETETEAEGKTKHQESVEAPSEAESEKQLKYVVTECEDGEAGYTYMYADPNSKKEVVLKLQKNSVVDVLDAKMIEDEIWAYTRYFGCSGWVNGEFLKRVGNMDSDNYGVGRYYISAEETSLRSEPDGTGEEIVTFKYGAVIQVKSMENGWAYVNFRPQPEYITGNGGGAGYIDATCISKNVLGSYVVNTEEDTGVGLRRTPRIEENNKIGNVPGGTNVKISAIQNGWGKTEYNGTEGWIMLKYLYLDKKDAASNESEQENADEQETFDILMDVKEKTEKEAQKMIEELLRKGYESYSNENYEESVKNFQEAAERGNAEAQNRLGIAYKYGRGVARDDEQAAMWYQKAAEQGLESAQLDLANCYLYGDGVEQNSEKAAEWFEKAAMQGGAYSQYMIGKMYIQGNGVEKNKEKGKEWLKKAADQGYTPAQKLFYQ